MAAQTFVTDMQALNAAQQTTTQSQNNGQVAGQVVKSGGQGQTATIIQPSQAHSGQQFIVTSKFLTGDQSGEQQDQAGVQLQQNTSGQVVYQPQQSYEYQQNATMYAAPVSGTY